ncbi:type II toxin-antitoxin system mRNA interferase toxin, RelE/StbE family [soil metagenome]
MIIEWLPLALHHRVEQLEYIALDNPLAAADQEDEIEHQINMLAAHPKLGRPGRVKGTRELVIGRTPFIAVYRLVGIQRIQILHLLHGSQQWPPARRG